MNYEIIFHLHLHFWFSICSLNATKKPLFVFFFFKEGLEIPHRTCNIELNKFAGISYLVFIEMDF